MRKIENEIDSIRNESSEKSEMRKIVKCANSITVTLFCELTGYDIKTLNSSMGKGSYLLKVGVKTLTIPYETAKKRAERQVVLALYKIKGLRGFLRRAAETRLLKLKAQGKNTLGCCTPTANYPHPEILNAHLEMGYHLQGTCRPSCFVRRLYGSLENCASVKIFPPFLVKALSENIPEPVNQYLKEKIGEIFNLDYCIIYCNEDSTLKTETFNIINRADGLAVNNFMKHVASGVFPFKIVFMGEEGAEKELLENIGFFLASLFEINSGKIQIGASKNEGAGLVKIRIREIRSNKKLAELEKFIKNEATTSHIVEFGDTKFEESETEYVLNADFIKSSLELFNTAMGSS